MVAVNNPYLNPAVTTLPQSFVYTNNLFYFDRTINSSPKFHPDDGCLFSNGQPFTQYQLWKSNLYWRTDGGFGSDPQAFALQLTAGTGSQAPCNGNVNKYTFYTFAAWQQTVGEDAGAWCRIRGSRIRLIRRTIIRCPMGRPAWDLWCSIRIRPGGRMP